MHDIAVLIPAYQPGNALLEVVSGIEEQGFSTIVVVDDGSDQSCGPIFNALQERCVILRHAANCGKGRALKTGLNHIALEYSRHRGVVTVDADGQHDPRDVARVAQTLCEQNNPALVLGERVFPRHTPLRSRLGNYLTRHIFTFLVGLRLRDTQTGLRGISMSELAKMVVLSGEGYDYEMNMLVHAKALQLPIVTVPIRGIYASGNPTSHFNPLFDSLKIYFVLLRFVSSSVVSSCIDLLIYTFCIIGGAGIFWSLFSARAVSSFLNFIMNKHFVFLKKKAFMSCLAKYYALVLFIFFLSYLMVSFLCDALGMNAVLAKVVSESLLFVVSFLVQRAIVFHRG